MSSPPSASASASTTTSSPTAALTDSTTPTPSKSSSTKRSSRSTSAKSNDVAASSSPSSSSSSKASKSSGASSASHRRRPRASGSSSSKSKSTKMPVIASSAASLSIISRGSAIKSAAPFASASDVMTQPANGSTAATPTASATRAPVAPMLRSRSRSFDNLLLISSKERAGNVARTRDDGGAPRDNALDDTLFVLPVSRQTLSGAQMAKVPLLVSHFESVGQTRRVRITKNNSKRMSYAARGSRVVHLSSVHEAAVAASAVPSTSAIRSPERLRSPLSSPLLDPLSDPLDSGVPTLELDSVPAPEIVPERIDVVVPKPIEPEPEPEPEPVPTREPEPEPEPVPIIDEPKPEPVPEPEAENEQDSSSPSRPSTPELTELVDAVAALPSSAVPQIEIPRPVSPSSLDDTSSASPNATPLDTLECSDSSSRDEREPCSDNDSSRRNSRSSTKRRSKSERRSVPRLSLVLPNDNSADAAISPTTDSETSGSEATDSEVSKSRSFTGTIKSLLSPRLSSSTAASPLSGATPPGATPSPTPSSSTIVLAESAVAAATTTANVISEAFDTIAPKAQSLSENVLKSLEDELKSLFAKPQLPPYIPRVPRRKDQKKYIKVVLEQVSKNDREITDIIFTHCSLSHNGVRKLERALRTNTVVSKLDLSNYALANADADFPLLAESLANNSSITWIDMRNCGVGLKTARALEELARANMNLARVDLWERGYYGSIDEIHDAFSALHFLVSNNYNYQVFKAGKSNTLVLAKRNFVAIDAEAFLSKPEQLHYFDVSYNRISELPADHIGRLSNLVELYLNNNNLTAIPESIEYLVNLKKLTVNHNQLTTLPAGIIKLRALEVLQADHNELAALPRNIGMLNRLTLLTLGSNKISTLPEQLRLLKRLTTLDLAENRFHDLPDFVCTLPLLTTFEVQGNPFKEIPDEIVAQGGKRVLEYIRMRDTGSTSVYRMKLMLVGQGNVGKSSLLECFQSRKRTNKKINTHNVATDGIAIADVRIKSSALRSHERVEFNCWDFAGQDVYYATHQFFLTSRAIYVLVVNVVKYQESESRVEYWLRTINASAKGAKIVLVGTHIDSPECYPKYAKSVLEYFEAKFAHKYKNLCRFRAVSCTTGKGVNSLLRTLADLALEQSYMPETIPNSILSLEKEIQILLDAQRSSSVTFEAFQNMARACGVHDSEMALQVLSDLGVLCYFPMVDASLVILEPQWIIDSFATIITLKYMERLVKHGLMNESDLQFLWRPPRFPEHVHGFILSLLEKFEVISLLPSSPKVLLMQQLASLPEHISSRKIQELWAEHGSSAVQSLSSTSLLSDDANSEGPLESDATSFSNADNNTTTDGAESSDVVPDEPPCDRSSDFEDHRPDDEQSVSRDNKSTSSRSSAALASTGGRSATTTSSATTSSSSSASPPSATETTPKCSPPTSRVLFIPALLPDSDNSRQRLENLWNAMRTTSSAAPDITELGRIYRFEFLPMGFFPRIIVRLMRSLDWSAVDYWKHGIIFSKRGDIGYLRLLDRSHTLYLNIRGPTASTALMGMTENIDALARDALQVGLEVLVPCTHCLQCLVRESPDRESHYYTLPRGEFGNDEDDDGDDDDQSDESARDTTNKRLSDSTGLTERPYCFFLKECEAAVTAGKRDVKCALDGAAVSLDDLVPDVSMSQFRDHRVYYHDLQIEKQIGEGGYAKVYRARYQNEYVAVKQLAINEETTNDEFLEVFAEFRREVAIMTYLQHENILGLKGLVLEPFCMVLEFMSLGSLYDFLHDTERSIDWPTRLSLVDDIARGMEFLHVNEMIHRDLKSPNILLTQSKGRVIAKVADFGLTRKSQLTPYMKAQVVENPVWVAPEILRKEEYTAMADVYSFGIIMWEILSRESVFTNFTFLYEIEEAVLKGVRPPIPQDRSGIPRGFLSLMTMCWDGVPEQRPTFDKVVRWMMVIPGAPHFDNELYDQVAERVRVRKGTAAEKKRKRLSVALDSTPFAKAAPQKMVLGTGTAADWPQMPPPPSLPKDYNRANYPCHKVARSFQRRSKHELNIKKGDVVYVLQKHPHWWLAERKNKVGWVPAQFINPKDKQNLLNPQDKRVQVQHLSTLTAAGLAVAPPPSLSSFMSPTPQSPQTTTGTPGATPATAPLTPSHASQPQLLPSATTPVAKPALQQQQPQQLQQQLSVVQPSVGGTSPAPVPTLRVATVVPPAPIILPPGVTAPPGVAAPLSPSAHNPRLGSSAPFASMNTLSSSAGSSWPKQTQQQQQQPRGTWHNQKSAVRRPVMPAFQVTPPPGAAGVVAASTVSSNSSSTLVAPSAASQPGVSPRGPRQSPRSPERPTTSPSDDHGQLLVILPSIRSSQDSDPALSPAATSKPRAATAAAAAAERRRRPTSPAMPGSGMTREERLAAILHCPAGESAVPSTSATSSSSSSSSLLSSSSSSELASTIDADVVVGADEDEW